MDNNGVSIGSITAMYHDLLQQWNNRSAAGMSVLFAQNGILIGYDGSQLNGQKQIHEVLDEIFTHHPTASYISIVKEVRALAPGSALLLAVVGMVGQGKSDITPEVNALQTLVVSIENDEPKIALFQNTPAAFHGRPELSDQLSADLRAALQAAQSS